jgi:hypothetical protein
MKEVLTLKEIMETEDLAKHIAEDIDDIPVDAPITYEVWAIGYNDDSAVTDSELLLSEFNDPDKAIEFAKTVSLATIVHQAAEEDNGTVPNETVSYIQVEVETVVEDSDINETMNIGTIYKRILRIDEEDNAISEDEYSEVVSVTAKDYTLLEDGSIEIDREVLKDFNKNDTVQLRFVEEFNTPILTYKIISKTTNNKYVCEFIY